MVDLSPKSTSRSTWRPKVTLGVVDHGRHILVARLTRGCTSFPPGYCCWKYRNIACRTSEMDRSVVTERDRVDLIAAGTDTALRYAAGLGTDHCRHRRRSNDSSRIAADDDSTDRQLSEMWPGRRDDYLPSRSSVLALTYWLLRHHHRTTTI